MPTPVWTVEASGADEVVESYGYRTDVLKGYGGREQRISQRAVPVESLEFSFLCEDPRRAGLAESLLWALQDEVLAVPLWQYGSRLTADVGVGAALLPIADAQDVPYRAGGPVVVWRDHFTFELVTVASTSGAGVALSDLTALAWASGTALVFPARLARVASKVAVRHEGPAVLSGRPVFTAETAEATVPAAESLALYRGLGVLDVQPDAGEGADDEVSRRVFLLDSGTGTRAVEAPAAAPETVRTFAWLCFSRAEAKTLRGFLDARRGRWRPFWVPAWEQDFQLAADHSAASSVLVVLGRDYAAKVFPAGQARRHLAVRAPGGVTYYRHVESAVDNGNGTESLTLDEAVPPALPATGTQVASLRYARLDEDEPKIEWTGGQFASALLPVRELAAETPA